MCRSSTRFLKLIEASAWRYVTQLPQGRNAARVSGLCRVRGGFSVFVRIWPRAGAVVGHCPGRGRTVEGMNDAQQPTIRDPHARTNLVGPNADRPGVGSASDDVIDPLAAGPCACRRSHGPAGCAGYAGLIESASRIRTHDSNDIDRGLARLDPLTVRPRTSSRVLCVVFGLLLIAAGFGVWWCCVFTENGQSYDEMVLTQLVDNASGWSQGIFALIVQSWLVIAASCAIAAVGVITALIRRRWWLVGQVAVFAAVCLAATRIKGLLPRPFIINTEFTTNSAPSGHTMLAAACAVILLLTMPRAARALASVIGVAWAVLVGVSVIYGPWHRPSDVAMSILLVAGLALITLAFTRRSGMDEPGRRVSSVSVQIVGSVLITGGLLLLAYSAYIIWQVEPGLNIIASWAVPGAIISAVAGITGVGALAFGLVLAMRQITAAPLSRLGLIGAPPAPPKQ